MRILGRCRIVKKRTTSGEVLDSGKVLALSLTFPFFLINQYCLPILKLHPLKEREKKKDNHSLFFFLTPLSVSLSPSPSLFHTSSFVLVYSLYYLFSPSALLPRLPFPKISLYRFEIFLQKERWKGEKGRANLSPITNQRQEPPLPHRERSRKRFKFFNPTATITHQKNQKGRMGQY